MTIGDDCLIAAHVVISSITHDRNAVLHGKAYGQTLIAKPVVVDENVWIGTAAVLLPGVHIGANSIIGAGAVVTKDVPPGSVMVGVPARATDVANGAAMDSEVIL